MDLHDISGLVGQLEGELGRRGIPVELVRAAAARARSELAGGNVPTGDFLPNDVPPHLIVPLMKLAAALQKFSQRRTSFEMDFAEILREDAELRRSLGSLDPEVVLKYIRKIMSPRQNQQVLDSRREGLDDVQNPCDDMFTPNDSAQIRERGTREQLCHVFLSLPSLSPPSSPWQFSCFSAHVIHFPPPPPLSISTLIIIAQCPSL